MLFKIANLLIIADTKEQAKRIYTDNTGIDDVLSIEVIIPREQCCAVITPALTHIDTIETMYNACLRCINDKYQDTYGAVVHLMKYVSELNNTQLNGIFNALINTKYNETRPLLVMLNAISAIPEEWHVPIQKHVSRFWIRRVDPNFHLDKNNMAILKIIGKNHIDQLGETSEHELQLDKYMTDSVLLKLLNSVNFCYETLYEFTESRPYYGWVLDHYDFKQKLIRDGDVICINDE